MEDIPESVEYSTPEVTTAQEICRPHKDQYDHRLHDAAAYEYFTLVYPWTSVLCWPIDSNTNSTCTVSLLVVSSCPPTILCHLNFVLVTAPACHIDELHAKFVGGLRR